MAVPMTFDQADSAWDILVQHVGASPGLREDFFDHQTAGATDEYRFQGALGFGGKFWNCNGRWYVTTYPEDMTPERAESIEAANAALAALRVNA